MIMSHESFMWLCSGLTAGMGLFWVVWDLLRLIRFLPKGKDAHDEIFGSILGVMIALFACVGVLRYHLG